MHLIEPYFQWRHMYNSQEDERSPFFGAEYNEFEFTRSIYNYYIHPQWDYFGSDTLYMKAICVDYENGFAIIELLGEWNDAINNDIMFLKRDIADVMINYGINKFILIGENVLNFHLSDDCYYQEWFDDVEDGWIVAINFREHVLKEFSRANIDYYFVCGGELDDLNWRNFMPGQLFNHVENIIHHRLQ